MPASLLYLGTVNKRWYELTAWSLKSLNGACCAFMYLCGQTTPSIHWLETWNKFMKKFYLHTIKTLFCGICLKLVTQVIKGQGHKNNSSWTFRSRTSLSRLSLKKYYLNVCYNVDLHWSSFFWLKGTKNVGLGSS